MKKSLRGNILSFVEKKFNISGDSPWKKYPDFVVLRHPDNRKWFGLVMNLPKCKLGISGEDTIDVLNVKTDPVVIGGFVKQKGIMPAYHMNKASWVSILLDGSVPISDIEFLINISYELTRNKKGVK